MKPGSWHFRRIIASAVAWVLLLAPGESSAAQVPERGWALAVAGGLALQPERQDDHLALVGGHAAAAVSARVAPGVGLRLEGVVTNFGEWVNHIHGPCPPDAGPFGCHPPVGLVRLRALTVGAVVARPGRRGYGALGGGAYQLAAHPTERGRTRAGAYGAVGRVLARGRPGMVLEAQLHWVPGLRLGGSWSAPVRLGVTF